MKKTKRKPNLLNPKTLHKLIENLTTEEMETVVIQIQTQIDTRREIEQRITEQIRSMASNDIMYQDLVSSHIRKQRA